MLVAFALSLQFGFGNELMEYRNSYASVENTWYVYTLFSRLNLLKKKNSNTHTYITHSYIRYVPITGIYYLVILELGLKVCKNLLF